MCDPFLFSLYAFSGLLLSVYRCRVLRRAVLERLEKKRKKKRQKKLRDAMRCVYPIWREKREENDFFLLLDRKKSRAREIGCRGREREKEAAARRVH